MYPGLEGSIIILKTENGMQKNTQKNLKEKYQKLFHDGKLETENLSLSFDSNTQNSKGIREGLLKTFAHVIYFGPPQRRDSMLLKTTTYKSGKRQRIRLKYSFTYIGIYIQTV